MICGGFVGKRLRKGGVKLERKHIDFASAIAFAALSVYVILEGYGYYQAIQVRGHTPFYESPGFFPMVIGGALLICSIMLLARSLRGNELASNIKNIKDGAQSFLKSATALKSLIGCTWMGLYVFFLLPQFNFRLGSVIFLVGLILFLQVRKIYEMEALARVKALATILTASIISVLATYQLFQVIFRVPLP